jgi:hypothetical protein
VPWLQTRIETRDRFWQAVREVGAADVEGDGFSELVVGYPGRVTTSSSLAADGGTFGATLARP